jgi:hypothetical protein
MVNFLYGKIYRLFSDENTLQYIGSTTQKLSHRLSQHKHSVNRLKLTTASILIKNTPSIKIELLEDYPCLTSVDLLKKEGEYIKNNICVNKHIAGRTPSEYYADNREHKINTSSLYYYKNRENILSRRREKRKIKKEE